MKRVFHFPARRVNRDGTEQQDGCRERRRVREGELLARCSPPPGSARLLPALAPGSLPAADGACGPAAPPKIGPSPAGEAVSAPGQSAADGFCSGGLNVSEGRYRSCLALLLLWS